MSDTQERLLRLREVMDQTGLCRTTIYNKMARAEFPHSVPTGPNSVRWAQSQIQAWIHQQINGQRERAVAA